MPSRPGLQHEPDAGYHRARNAQVLPIPALMMRSMIFLLVSFWYWVTLLGKDSRAKLGIVDQDGGTQALKVVKHLIPSAANVRTFEPIYYDMTSRQWRSAQRQDPGRRDFPPQYYGDHEGNHPRIALIVDNSDNFMSSALEGNSLNGPTPSISLRSNHACCRDGAGSCGTLSDIEYMKFAAGSSRCHFRFGDRWRHATSTIRPAGHEGYLSHPITKTEWCSD